MKYFNYEEFDSPMEAGSGKRMQDEFLVMLDNARDIAGIPFKITSGYRIKADIDRLLEQGYKVSTTSSHLKGWAADIGTPSSVHRYRILDALLKAGFNRIGIADTFIHVDCDPDKPVNVIWTY
jgi:zinc D-Ala-D-Ala carboxypeptidase